MKKFKLLFIFLVVSISLFAQSIEQKMEELMQAYVANGGFNGSVLVAQKGSVLFHKAYGYRDAAKKLAHKPDDIYQIGSITKQITAAVIMQLQEEGKLSVQDKLSKFFPGFTNGDKITIEHLLTHTSGIYNYTNDTSVMSKDVTRHYSQQEMVSLFKTYKPDFEPGAKWNYSNSGYSLLGYIIEKVDKKPYEQAVRQRIFYPLGMTSSGFDFTHLQSERKSKGYFSMTNGNGLAAPIVDSTIAYAAGAIYSTTEDLFKWERAIATGKILKPATWQVVFTPFKNKYGYGWGIDSVYGKPVQAHSGGIHGFTSYLIRYPEDEVVVILLDNASSSKLNPIARSLAAIVLGQPYQIPTVRKELQLDTAVLKRFVGEYQLAPNFIITVTVEGNQLKAQATGQPQFELFAEAENKFFLKVVDAQIEFVKDEKGNVTELILFQNGMTPRGKKIK